MTTKNSLTKQELVAFDEMVEGFEEALVYDRLVDVMRIGSPNESLRANDTKWLPMPLEVDSQEGRDQTGNFVGVTELSVPVNVNRHRVVPLTAHAGELRDPHLLKRMMDSAKERLASNVNDDIRRQIAFNASIVDARAGQAKGFDDLGSLMMKFDELGLPTVGRKAMYSTRDFVPMASDLASRQQLMGKTQTAYEKARINEIAGFDVLTDPSAVYLQKSTVTGATISGANQRHTPKATIKNVATGDEHNVDNRYMTLNVNVGGGAFKVGDAFTITGVYAVHHKNKNQTGDLKTFRVVEVMGANQIKVSPAIVCDDYVGATTADTVYKNVSATPADGSAINILNRENAYVNTAFIDKAVTFLPSTLAIDELDGMRTAKATLSNGLTLFYSRQGEINDLSAKVRWDIVYGTALLNPEMAGIQLFNQG